MYTLFNNIVSDTIHSIVVRVDFLKIHIMSLVLFGKLGVTPHQSSPETFLRARDRRQQRPGPFSTEREPYFDRAARHHAKTTQKSSHVARHHSAYFSFSYLMHA